MKKEREPIRISFEKVLAFIENGEEAQIVLNEKRYNIKVKVDNKNSIYNYCVNQNIFENKKDFIDYICKESSIELNDNSLVTLISIGDRYRSKRELV